MAIKSSDSLRGSIRDDEGFQDKAYPDAKTGKLAVGYGIQTTDPNARVTRDEGELQMRNRIKLAEDELSKVISRKDLPQGKQDVLVDMHYNLGLGGMRDFIDLVNSGDDARAAQEILRYTKAFNEETGKHEDVPALQKRVNKRANWWNAQTAQAFQSDDILNEAMDEVMASQFQTDDLLDSAIAEVQAENDTMMAETENPSRLNSGLELASDAASNEQALRDNEARRVSELSGIPFEQAQAELAAKPFKDVMADQKRALISEYFPASARWAQDPANYSLMRETEDYARKVEVAGRPLNADKRGDWEKALDNNRVMLKDAFNTFYMTVGAISIEQGKKNILEIDMEQQANALTTPGAKRLQETIMDPNASFLDKLWAAARDPEAFAQLSLQSQGSTAAIMGASIAGGAAGTLAGGPAVGVAGGALSAYAISHLLSFNEYMKGQLEEFRDKATGIIDVDKAYSDPERVKRWVREADIYGLTMGTADAAFSLISGPLGQGVAKYVFKSPAKSAAGKVAAGAVKVGAQTAAKPVEEGASQVAATSAVDFYKSELTPDKFAKNLKEGENEALLSIVSGAGMTTVGLGVNRVLENRQNAAAKTAQVLTEANQANEDVTALSGLRAQRDANEASRTNPDQVQDLVEESVAPAQAEEDLFEPATADVEPMVASEVKTMKREADADTVSISPSEWDKYHKLQNTNPIEALQGFTSDVQQMFARNRESDSSVVIPISQWIRFTEEDPGIDVIARINGNDLNALEANDHIEVIEKDPFSLFQKGDVLQFPPLKSMNKIINSGNKGNYYDDWASEYLEPEEFDALQAVDFLGFDNADQAMQAIVEHDDWMQRWDIEDPREVRLVLQAARARLKGDRTLFQKEDVPEGWDEVPGLPEETDPAQERMTVIEPDSAEGNAVLRPVELTGRFRNDEDKQVSKSIMSRLKRATKDATNIAPESMEIIAEIQFQHLKNRAEILGVPVNDLASKFMIGKLNKGNERGIFRGAPMKGWPFGVFFNKTALPSTVIHELGHAWLFQLSEDYDTVSGIPEESMTPAQQEYKYAMDMAADLLGLENIGQLNTADQNIMERAQEIFAQTTEKYFLEGKLANNRMRGLIEAFRKWLTPIINLIAKTYRQYPPLKLTPEVERMFEGILGASTMVEEEIIPMFPTPLFDPEMLGKDGQKYIERIRDARSQAIGEAYTKAFNQGIKERDKAIEASITKIQDQAAAEVDELPAMVVRRSFEVAYQEHLNDPDGNTPDPRLSLESVARVLFGGDEVAADALKKSIPSYIIKGKKKGGLDVALYMQMAGITDPGHMTQVLVETGMREDLIEQRANQIIDENFPPFKSEEEIHAIAVEAVNGRGKEKLLLDEMKILATKYLPALRGAAEKAISPAVYLAKASKERIAVKAADLVRDTPAYKFNSDKFLRDSNRQGRQAARLFRAGNILESFDAKYREALHFFSYGIAKGAEKEVAATRARVKQFVKYSRSKDLANTFDADVMAYGRQVIQAVSAGVPLPEFSTANFSRFSGITDAQVEEINRSITDFMDQAQGKYGKNITVGGYTEFGKLLRQLMDVAKRAKQVEVDKKWEKYDKVTAGIVTGVMEKQGVVDFTGNTGGSALRRSLVTTRALFESLYGSTEAFVQSDLGKLFNSVVDAEAGANIAFTNYNDRIVKAVRNAVGNDSGMKGILNPILNRIPGISKDKKNQPIISPRGELNFTFNNKAEIHMANLLVLGSESGAKKFLLGYKLAAFDPETSTLDVSGYRKFINRMIKEGVITKKDFEMYQEIWDVYADIHPQVRDAMRQSDGFNMGKIDGWSFETDLGAMKGGYVPVAAKEGMTVGPINSLLDPETQGFRAADMYPHQNTGMTNERNERFYEVDLDMSRLSMNLRAAVNIAYLRNPLMDFGRTIAAPEVTAAIESRRPGAIGDEKGGVVVRWFNAVKGQEYTEYSDDLQDRLAKKLRQNTNMALYLVSMMSPLRQFFGVTAAMKEISLPRLLAATGRQMATPRALRQEISEKSVVMQNRLRDSQEQMIRSWDKLETNFDWINWTDEKVRGLQYFFIQLTQNMVDVTIWSAAYEKGSSKGMEEADAIRYADTIVETTQSSQSVSSMSNIQRGKDTWKFVTMVSSVPLALHNLGQVEIMRDQSKAAKLRMVAALGATTMILPTFLDQVLSEGLDFTPPDEDKDEEELEEEANTALMLRMITGSLDTVLPIYARPISSSIMVGAATLSPGFNKLNKIPSAINAAKHLGQGVDWSANEMAAFMDTLTIISGIPFSVVGRGRKLGDSFMSSDELAEAEEIRREQLLIAREGEE